MIGVKPLYDQTGQTQDKHECTCGQHLELETNKGPATTTGTSPSDGTCSDTVSTKPSSMPFEASFIQVPSSLRGTLSRNEYLLNGAPKGQQPENDQYPCSVETCIAPEFMRTLTYLQKAAMSSDHPPPLCMGCLKRVSYALEADSDRLQMECLTYYEAIQEDESRIRLWKQAMTRAAIVSSNGADDGEEVLSGTHNDISHLDLAHATEVAFRNEILLLESACQQYHDELASLRTLEKELAVSNRDFDHLQEALAEEQNALELEARAFDNDQEQLARELGCVQDEVERLSSPDIRLPIALVHLQVDVERGLRYPLINELRLAYRPKGDIEWKEIQAAWALAAELLLVIATLFQFQSQHWKIVPLSNCAKLIYRIPGAPNDADGGSTVDDQKPRIIVFNLGHPKTNGCKALLTWNALMHQVVQHMKLKLAEAFDNAILEKTAIPPLPFTLSSTSIGGISLQNLDANDDVGWSRVTHYMASVLLWMAECASSLILSQVLLATPLVADDKVESDS